MLQHIEIEPTYKTPKVSLNPATGEIKIQGNSILVDVEEFYNPILDWMEAFIAAPTVTALKCIFDFNRTNVASTKRILFILYKLGELRKMNVKVKVEWLYVNNDTITLEIGQDFAQMLGMEFEFIGYERLMQSEISVYQ